MSKFFILIFLLSNSAFATENFCPVSCFYNHAFQGAEWSPNGGGYGGHLNLAQGQQAKLDAYYTSSRGVYGFAIGDASPDSVTIKLDLFDPGIDSQTNVETLNSGGHIGIFSKDVDGYGYVVYNPTKAEAEILNGRGDTGDKLYRKICNSFLPSK